jgi:tRNA pseudouridine13 synthase
MIPRPAQPEDFAVDEIPLYAPSGLGEHTFVKVEKRLRTTDEVVRMLARAAGVAPREVGAAGRKDRVAVATQWLSVPRLDPALALRLELPGVRVLEAVRHPHKLRTGQLRGNRFRILLREVDEAAIEAGLARAGELERRGMRNRFGAQRFGRDGDNALRGRSLLEGEAPAGRDRREARFLLSALQAAVFNDVLAARGEGFDGVEVGDVAVVHASGGLFRVEDAAREAPRAAAFEISATGPIFGTRTTEPAGAVAERERALLEAHGIPQPLRPPRGIPLRGARRALRVRPAGLALARVETGLELRFALPAGSFATVLLEELLGPGAL